MQLFKRQLCHKRLRGLENKNKENRGGVDGPGYAFGEAVVRALEQKYERAAAINYAMVFFASADMKARVLLHVCINIYRLDYCP